MRPMTIFGLLCLIVFISSVSSSSFSDIVKCFYFLQYNLQVMGAPCKDKCKHKHHKKVRCSSSSEEDDFVVIKRHKDCDDDRRVVQRKEPSKHCGCHRPKVEHKVVKHKHSCGCDLCSRTRPSCGCSESFTCKDHSLPVSIVYL